MDVLLWLVLVLILIAVAILVGSASLTAKAEQTAASFVTGAARGGMAEVVLSQIASESARDHEVRTFAALVLADQSRTAYELRRLAAAKKWRLPANLDPLHRAMARRLQRLSGAAFDLAYLQAIVMEHDRTVEMFQEYARTGDDLDLRQWVEKALPALEEQQRVSHATAEGWRDVAPRRTAAFQSQLREDEGSRAARVPQEA